MTNKLIISLAGYQLSDGYDVLLKGVPGDWSRLWQCSFGSYEPPPSKSQCLKDVTKHFKQNSIQLKIYIEDLKQLLYSNDGILVDLRNFFTISKNSNAIEIVALVNIGKYWQIKQEASFKDILEVFGEPAFPGRADVTSYETIMHGGLEPLKRVWQEEIRRLDFPYKCNDIRSECRKVIGKSETLLNILRDLDTCGGLKILKNAASGNKPRKNDEVVQLLRQVGLIEWNDQGKLVVRAKMLAIAAQENDPVWKIKHHDCSGFGRAFLFWLVSLWSNQKFITITAALSLMVAIFTWHVFSPNTSVYNLHWLRVINIVLLTIVSACGWRLSTIKPQPLLSMKTVVSIANWGLVLLFSISLSHQPKITGFTNPIVEYVSYDDWLFNDDVAQIIVQISNTRLSCDTSVSTGSEGGLATEKCELDKDGDIHACPLRAVGRQSGKAKAEIEITVSCDDTKIREELTTTIHRFGYPSEVRRFLVIFLSATYLIPFIVGFVPRLKEWFTSDIWEWMSTVSFLVVVSILFWFLFAFGIPGK